MSFQRALVWCEWKLDFELCLLIPLYALNHYLLIVTFFVLRIQTILLYWFWVLCLTFLIRDFWLPLCFATQSYHHFTLTNVLSSLIYVKVHVLWLKSKLHQPNFKPVSYHSTSLTLSLCLIHWYQYHYICVYVRISSLLPGNKELLF